MSMIPLKTLKLHGLEDTYFVPRFYSSLKDIGITTFPTTMQIVAETMPENSMIVIDSRRINGASDNSTETISDWGKTNNGVATIMKGYSKDRIGLTLTYGSTSASDADFYFGNFAYTANTVNWSQAAFHGYGYDGEAVRLSTSQITTEADLEAAIEAVYSGMATRETKMITWTGYPAGDYNWFGILSKSSANYGSLEAHSAYNYGTSISKHKTNGTWNSLGVVNPYMTAGKECRTTERFMGNPVYVTIVDIGYLSKGTNTITHNLNIHVPISLDIINNDNEILTHSINVTDLYCGRTQISITGATNFGNIRAILKYTKQA